VPPFARPRVPVNDESETHVPLYCRQPLVRLSPLEKVEVAPPPWVMAPVLLMVKRVVVAKAAVEEEIEKRVGVLKVEEAAKRERRAVGEEVPIPTFPLARKVVVAAPPKYATVAESCEEEAFVNCERPVAERLLSPVMLWLLPVTAPPRVKAGSVLERLGTPEELVTRMEEAEEAVAPMALPAWPKRMPLLVRET